MSTEVISSIIVAAGLLVSLGGGFLAGLAWLVRRMDEKFDKVYEQFGKVDERFNRVHDRFDKVDDRFAQADAKVDARFAQADASINARFNKVDEQFKVMGAQMSGLRTELNDVKVAVARLEGPHQRLILPPY